MTEVCIVKVMVFPVVTCGCESWTIKKAERRCFWLVLEKTLESPLDSKEIKLVNPKGNQPWILIGRTDAKAEAPILWPPDVKSWLIGKNWCWERLKAKGEKGSRGWDGWVSSPIQWTCTWVNSGRCWETGKPGVLQSMGPQKLSYWRTTKTLISE